MWTLTADLFQGVRAKDSPGSQSIIYGFGLDHSEMTGGVVEWGVESLMIRGYVVYLAIAGVGIYVFM